MLEYTSQDTTKFYIHFLNHIYRDLGYIQVKIQKRPVNIFPVNPTPSQVFTITFGGFSVPLTPAPAPAPLFNQSYVPNAASTSLPHHFTRPAPVETDYIELVDLVHNRLDIAGYFDSPWLSKYLLS